jgi:hypothetical protein
MIDVDTMLLGAITAVVLLLAALGIAVALRRTRKPRDASYRVDWRSHRR